MRNLSGFFYNCKTHNSFPIAIVGLVYDEYLAEIERDICKISECRAGDTLDIYNIDVCLAETASSVCGTQVLAVGLNINVSEVGLSTGGVIGNPNVDYESSDDSLEQISPNLWCYSRAGGPGFVLACEHAIAEQITLEFECNPVWDSFISLVKSHCIETYIYVEDGTANGGFIAVSAHNIKKTHKL